MIEGAGYAVGKHRAKAHEQQSQQTVMPHQTSIGHESVQSGCMSQLDRLNALTKIGELNDSGVLTYEQFDALKERLI